LTHFSLLAQSYLIVASSDAVSVGSKFFYHYGLHVRAVGNEMKPRSCPQERFFQTSIIGLNSIRQVFFNQVR
jgi:hypothetical protein